jgi:hypothetical protein
MRYVIRIGLALCFGAGFFNNPAAAQYGGWWGGWGGYGGGQTVAGSTAMGMGNYYAGLGQARVDTAQATSIDADTVMRWNDYMWSSQNNVNRHFMARRAKEKQENLENFTAIQDRIHKDPTAQDITNGDALNAAVQQLTQPRVMNDALRRASAMTISSQVVKQVRWFHSTDAVTFSLYNLTSDANWPRELKRPEFDTVRKDFITVMEKALDEEYKGQVSDATRAEIKRVVANLKAKAEQVYPVGTPERSRLERRRRTLDSLVDMIKSSDIGPALAQLDKVSQVTLADVLGFTQTFNLRFGVAMNDREMAALREIYGMLDTVRDQVAQDAAVARADVHTPAEHAEQMFDKVATPPPAPKP